MLEMRRGQHIHLIGIGGAGLSAIARILLSRGFQVSGSDLHASEITASLRELGASVHHGHSADFVGHADWVLASSAVPPEHVEVRAARARGIPVLNRRQFLPALLRGYQVIAVAGTHGKTTTTSMIVHILRAAGQDPSFIVGGALGNSGDSAALGKGVHFVIEADEYDNMFHGLGPRIAVVTNVEHDHPDFFKSLEQMQNAFRDFVNQLPDDGPLVACADDAGAARLLHQRRAAGLPVTSYGLKTDEADWRAVNPRHGEMGVCATILRKGEKLGELRLALPGAHNILNALAALAIAEACGVGFADSGSALRSFRSTARRFQIRGQRDGIIVVDDYAHHPTEIRVNIEAARQRYPGHQIVVIWQPHTYSRVRQFWADFTRAFAGADQTLVTPIYPAREQPIAGINSRALVDAMSHCSGARYVPDFEAAAKLLHSEIDGPALALICSAGDANRIAELFLDRDAFG